MGQRPKTSPLQTNSPGVLSFTESIMSRMVVSENSFKDAKTDPWLEKVKTFLYWWMVKILGSAIIYMSNSIFVAETQVFILVVRAVYFESKLVFQFYFKFLSLLSMGTGCLHWNCSYEIFSLESNVCCIVTKCCQVFQIDWGQCKLNL